NIIPAALLEVEQRLFVPVDGDDPPDDALKPFQFGTVRPNQNELIGPLTLQLFVFLLLGWFHRETLALCQSIRRINHIPARVTLAFLCSLDEMARRVAPSAPEMPDRPRADWA